MQSRPPPPPPAAAAAAATGYPANPNPNSYGNAYPQPPPHYYPQPYPTQRASFLRRFFAILIASFIIAGTIVFIIWIVLRPRLPEFRLDSLTLSNFNLSSSSSLITGNWDVRLTARNPNTKITLYYNRIDAFVFYKAESIAGTTVPPFVQGTKNETAVRASFAAARSYVDGWVVEGINWERANRGSVNFNVRLLARVRFRAGAWRNRWRLVRVYCGELPVGISANGTGGTLLGGARQCRVGL